MRLSFRRPRKKDGHEPEIDAAAVHELEDVLAEKETAIAALQSRIKQLNGEVQTQLSALKRAHPLEPIIHMVDENGTRAANMGRHASLATTTALNALPAVRKKDELAQKIIAMFKHPEMYTDYLQSDKFAKDVQRLCAKVQPLLQAEPRCVFLQSPVYVFGDIHGNLEDLNFFADNIWKLGMNLTAGKFLFLGDYVDRGMLGLECLAYLFALKIENPGKLFMLRGNHELRDVNGWVDHYQDRSFLWQCQNRFGAQLGETVWECCNCVFDRMPLAAVIDHDIFCVHGGIPRPMQGSSSRVQDIMTVPSVAGVCPPNELETFESQQIASDCLWSDPARDEQELVLDQDGFGESMRGGGAICFGTKAIDDFLKQGNLSYIVRAHEAHSEGVSLSKGAKVFTVFSTSKDHGQGKGAMCGCILVDFEKLLVINRSAKYKNKYIHRRDSVSLLNLSANDIRKRAELGLVSQEVLSEESGEEEEEQNDFEGYYDHAVNQAEDHYSSEDESKSNSNGRGRKK